MSCATCWLHLPEPRGASSDRRVPPRREARSTPVSQSSTAYRGKSQTDLTVLTAEGDRVTISLAAQVQSATNAKTNAQTSSQARASQLRVSVEGNLSDAELKDLRRLIGKLSEAISTPTPSADPTGFAALTSLSAFAYRYQQIVEATVNVTG